MARYIDADILAKTVFDKWQECDELKHIIPAIKRAIMYEATDDVAKVVRCKDCKHLVRSEGVCKVLSNNYEPPVFVDDDDFCSRGERMEDNDE